MSTISIIVGKYYLGDVGFMLKSQVLDTI